MKHIRNDDYSAATLQPAMETNKPSKKWGKTILEMDVPINAIERFVLKLVEFRPGSEHSILLTQRQILLPGSSEWRQKTEIGLSFDNFMKLYRGYGRIVEIIKGD
jgi:hypothetical protein